MKNRVKIDYKWVIAAVSFLMVFVSLGFCSSAKSIFLKRITEALAVKRSVFSISDSCRYVTTSIVNLFFGTLIAKFGARKLIAAGFLSLIISTVLYAVGTQIWTFYIGGVFLGLGFSWTTTTIVGSVVGKWFKKGKGTVMGAVLASNGLGGALAVQILSPIIEQSTFSYRKAYWLVVAILVAVGVIVVGLFRNEPKKTEENAEQPSETKKDNARSWVGVPFQDVLKSKHFYVAAVCVFLAGFTLQGITGVSNPLMKDAGLDPAFVDSVMSINLLALTAFKFLTGFAYDKFGLRKVSFVCYTAAILAMFILSVITDSITGKVLAVTYAFVSTMALPLETVLIPIFAMDLFGEKPYNKVLGLFASINTAGYALGAPITNLCYDLTNSYNFAIYVCCGLMLVAVIALQYVFRASKNQRKSVENAD